LEKASSSSSLHQKNHQVFNNPNAKYDAVKTNATTSTTTPADFIEIEPTKESSKKLAQICAILAQLNKETSLNNGAPTSHQSDQEYLRVFLSEYFNNVESITDLDIQKLEDELINMTQYRLVKLNNSALIKSKENYVYDLIREKIVGYNSIKQMVSDGHKRLKDIKKKSVPNHEHTFITNDQRFFQKIYANMNFGSLRAVDKAYEERDVDERRKEKKKKANIVKDSKVIKRSDSS
jgi:hypothetical protein